MSEGKENIINRNFRNYLLQPFLQIKLGLYSVLLALGFVAGIISVLFLKLSELFQVILELTDVPEEVGDIINSHLSDTFIWVFVICVVFLVINVLVSVLFTHRLVGPTIAFRRHVGSLCDGNYKAKTFLRKKDAFSELADELNRLSDILDKSTK